MWQLMQLHSCSLVKQRLLTAKNSGYFINVLKSKPTNVLKRHISDFKVSTEKSAKCSEFLIFSPWKLCTGISLGLAARVLFNNGPAFCKSSQTSRIVQRRPNVNDDSSKFDWKKLFEYLWPHRWVLAAAVASALAVAFLNVYIPAMLGVIVNVLASMKTNPSADFIEEIKMPALKLISLYIGQAAFTFFYIHLLAQVGEKVALQMKQDLFESILRQDMAFFDSERTGELVNRLTVDVQDFKSSFKQTISGGLRAITQVIGSAVSLLVISPQLTTLTLVCVPSVVIGGTFIGSLLRKLSREAQSQIEKATLVAEEAISNMRTVRAFAGEENEARMFANECEQAADLSMELGLGVGLFQAGTNLFLNGMVLGTMFLGGHLMSTGQMSAGDVMAFLVNAQTVQRSVAQLSLLMVLGTMFLGGHLMSTGQMSAGDVMAFLVNAQTVQRSVAQLSLLFGSVVKGVSAGGRVFEYINKEPKMDTSGTKVIKYHEIYGDIEFKDVTFAYPTRPEAVVLKHFNLKIPAGKTVAIVGTSGNGKSTIAALLERFYDVNDGQVTIDGVDVREFDCKWLRGRALGLISQEPVLFATSVRENIRYGKPEASDAEVTIFGHHKKAQGSHEGQVTIDGVDVREFDCKWLRGRALGLISQEPVLFATSVRENIRYGKPEASDAEVIQAAMTANAHEFITQFPAGYDTLVGERGTALSGGQKQRVAIARAVLKNPPIIILDEATSALDSASEKVVQSALETAAKGRTVLVIAHRLSTVINADLIVVLNKGKIVEMGTHDQLKKQKGFYWNLIKQQDQDSDPSRTL